MLVMCKPIINELFTYGKTLLLDLFPYIKKHLCSNYLTK